MKRVVICILMSAFVLSASSQITEFTISKEGKAKTLYLKNMPSFTIDITGDSLDYGYIDYTGPVDDITPDGLLIHPESIESYGNTSGYSFDHSFYYDEPLGEVTKIDPATISSIYYQSNSMQTVSTVSGIIALLGNTTALIVAPLISINYKTGDFNKDLYYKVAGAGLITLGVTLPLAILTSGRTFTFRDLFDESSSGWEFEFEEETEW